MELIDDPTVLIDSPSVLVDGNAVDESSGGMWVGRHSRTPDKEEPIKKRSNRRADTIAVAVAWKRGVL